MGSVEIAGFYQGAGIEVEPIAMRVPAACRYIGISRSTLYLLIAEGRVEVVKLGVSTLVITESLRRLINERRA